MQIQVFTIEIVKSQFTIFHIKDTKTTFTNTINLNLKTCIIKVVKDKHLKKSL